jgi:hypothetical protein
VVCLRNDPSHLYIGVMGTLFSTVATPRAHSTAFRSQPGANAWKERILGPKVGLADRLVGPPAFSFSWVPDLWTCMAFLRVHDEIR